jgi:hypothetical protein
MDTTAALERSVVAFDLVHVYLVPEARRVAITSGLVARGAYTRGSIALIQPARLMMQSQGFSLMMVQWRNCRV